MSKIKTVFVAGPFTGDEFSNVSRAISISDQLFSLGYMPFCPHLFAFWHLVHPHEYEYWMTQTLFWLEKCDAVFRVEGESAGADREVNRARSLSIPVFESIEELISYD